MDVSTGVAPPASAPPTLNTTFTGQNTIYVNNLNERVKIPELKKCLYAIFSKFGKILDIVALKNLRMRGQAFIIFDQPDSAAQALTSMQSFPLYDKPLRIQFAKTDSDIVSKRKNTFVERPKRRNDSDLPSISKKEKRRQQIAAKEEQQRLLKAQLAAQFPGLPAGMPPMMPGMPPMMMPPPPMMNRPVLHPPIFGGEMPNNILFVSNLQDANESMLTTLFKAYNGFREVRLIPGREGIAFVEFDLEHHSAMEKDGLQGFKITPDKAMMITFAKK
jgi:RNA recognition motif-containing protein